MSWPSEGGSTVRTEPLYKTLGIRPGLTAIIGSGGKTSLMLHLCRELPGTVIVCTSTHILPPEELPLYTDPVDKLTVPKCCLGSWNDQGKLSAPVQPFEQLLSLADYVLVEADGSKRLPLKAHLPHEPVIPSCANQVIQVLGLSGLGKPVEESAHRPELYAQLCEATVETPVTPELAAKVLNREALADQYLLNQADDQERIALGTQLAQLLEKPAVLNTFR